MGSYERWIAGGANLGATPHQPATMAAQPDRPRRVGRAHRPRKATPKARHARTRADKLFSEKQSGGCAERMYGNNEFSRRTCILRVGPGSSGVIVCVYSEKRRFIQDTKMSTCFTSGSRYRAVIAVPSGLPGSFCQASHVWMTAFGSTS